MLLLTGAIAHRELWFDGRDRLRFEERRQEIELPAALRRAVAIRQREFVAGRLCGRDAIRAILPERADDVVAVGRRGEPLWPPGVVGSLAHAGGLAVAAVARAADLRALGVDVERLLSPAIADEIAHTVVAPDELDALARATHASRAQLVSIAFSAKESLFKCLYPLIGRHFDFRDARLVDVSLQAGTFVVALERALSPDFRAGASFTGTLNLVDKRVFTALWIATAA